MQNKGVILKRLLILELIVCYLAGLNIISHIRGPQQYQIDTKNPLVTVSDFKTFQGEVADGEGLHIVNSTQGSASGYSARISLRDLERIYISFIVDCPENLVGSGLCVDLYDQATGYDNPNQEYSLFFNEGINETSFMFEIEETTPDEADIRFFTGDVTEYTVDDLEIYKELPLPKVSSVMIGVFVGNLIVLSLMMIAYLKALKKNH